MADICNVILCEDSHILVVVDGHMARIPLTRDLAARFLAKLAEFLVDAP